MPDMGGKEIRANLLSLSGICGVLAAIVPNALVMLAVQLSGSFDWGANALSDLGVSPVAAVFNSGLVLGGLLTLVFSMGLFELLPRTHRVVSGIASFMLGSVSLTLVGVFTEHTLILHSVFALGYFTLTPLGFLLMGSGLSVGSIRRVCIWSGVAALLAIFALPLIIFLTSLRVGFAVPELAEALIVAAWTIFMSTKMIRRHQVAAAGGVHDAKGMP